MSGPPPLPPDDQSEPTPSHSGNQQEEEGGDYQPYGHGPTPLIMITEDDFPLAATVESHYAKEDTESMQVSGCSPD